MRRVLLPALLLALAGCAGRPAPRPDVEVTAAPDGDARWVCFVRRTPVPGDRPATVSCSAGRIDALWHSSDRTVVAVRWIPDGGLLRCTFPDGRHAAWSSGATLQDGWIDYMLYETEDVRVRTRVPRGCPLQPVLRLHVEVAPELLPARVVLPGGRTLALSAPSSTVDLPLPQAAPRRLAAGELSLAIEGASGARRTFLVVIDPDGTPAALSGYVANW